MITEHQQEQGSLFALGALSGDERRAFQAELGGNPELRELVRDLQRTAVLLARAVPGAKPPPDLRERLLRRIEKTMDDADAPVAESLSAAQYAATLSSVLGTPVKFVDVPVEALRSGMPKGMPPA